MFFLIVIIQTILNSFPTPSLSPELVQICQRVLASFAVDCSILGKAMLLVSPSSSMCSWVTSSHSEIVVTKLCPMVRHTLRLGIAVGPFAYTGDGL
ncbi:hypothetical protein F5880DRAFT_1596500 [Lentinula raphanica]|nr:hypothetical protein F5880DRAFT_1596500 [Lentinula raphanica]